MTNRKDEIIAALEQQARAKRENRLKSFQPYDKQQQFFEAGQTRRERCLSAGNQQGKSYAGAVEMAFHLTGDYPSWWKGRRFDHPVKAWACGISSQVVRDIQQSRLCGEPGVDASLGTGLIPKDKFVGLPSRSHGIADAFDTVHVRHASGGISVLTFKAYEQQRPKFQGAGVDVIWLDEECEMPIYVECLTRTNATGGMVYTTYTPVNGLTDLWERFSQPSPDRLRVSMTILDAEHISAEERQKIIASYAPHERDCRVNGTPFMGSGRIWTTPEEEISEEPFEIPEHYAMLWSIDPGVGHPFAATLLAWDRDNDVIHVVHTVRMADAMAIDQAAAMKAHDRRWGEKIPVAWPQDTFQRREFEGELVPLAKIYKSHGLRMLAGPATFPDGSRSTEAGIMLMGERFRAKKLRVFRTCPDWFEEYRQYHRAEGKIVKLRDDIMSATRVGVMAIRFASPVRLRARQAAMNPNGQIAIGGELSGDELF
jgi:phage terminase large subunit-like protein